MYPIPRGSTELSKLSIGLTQLPLPPATLVIDTRGTTDQVLETLQAEIENFSSDAQLHTIRHWRYFTNFIAFKAIDPLSLKEVEQLLTPKDATAAQAQNSSSSSAGNAVANPSNSQQKTGSWQGRIDPNRNKSFTPPHYQEETQTRVSPLGHIPNATFRNNIETCIKEIDTLRNRRINATADLGPMGDFARHNRDSMVRAVFLVDAKRADSLSTASVYAEYLKRYYNELEHHDYPTPQIYPLVFNTTIICTNHTNMGNAPVLLMNRLSGRDEKEPWKHINSLILCEEYREDAGWLEEEMQQYIAELILYVMLLIPPSAMRPLAPDAEQVIPTPSNTKRRDLPPDTYIMGISAIEHSVRWGRRYLNYGLADQMLQVLRNSPAADEQSQNENSARTWLTQWRAKIERAVPEHIPGPIPAMGAFTQAQMAAEKPTEQIFRSKGFTLLMQNTTEEDIKQYTNDIATTLTLSAAEQIERRRGSISSQQTALTLQDALDNLSQVKQNLAMQKTKGKGPENPLIEALREAQSILGNSLFFRGANGAIERARQQLLEARKCIDDLYDEHDTPIDLEQRRLKLEESSRNKLNTLDSNIQSFPRIGSIPFLKGAMAVLAFILALLLGLIGIVTIFALLRYLAVLAFPAAQTALTITLFNVSVFNLVLWIALVLTVIFIITGFGRYIFGKKRSALSVEVTCVSLLVAFAIVGMIVALSAELIRGQVGVFLVNPLSSLPFWCAVAFTLALVILVIEAVSFFSWSKTWERERAKIIDELRKEHEHTRLDVILYLADAIALDLLKRAGLTDGNRGQGEYYHHVETLSAYVDGVQAETHKQYERAEESLLTKTSATMNPQTSSLLIRAEQLNVQELIANYNLLGRGLEENREEINQLAEALIRAMGTERIAIIDKQLCDRLQPAQQNSGTPILDRREQHKAQVLMSTSVAVTTRIAIGEPASTDVPVLDERYKGLDHRTTPLFAGLRPLIDMLQHKVSKPQSSPESVVTQEEVAAAMAAWGQTLWAHKIASLNELLNSGGVMEKLVQEKYSPQTVRNTLEILANLVGRPVMPEGLVGELYLLMFPSQQGRQFFQNQHIGTFIDFPDAERLVLLFVQHYMALPEFVLLPDQDDQGASVAANSTNIVDSTPPSV
jgi:hypothetical protein